MNRTRALRALQSLIWVDWKRRQAMMRCEAWVVIVLAHVLLAAAWALPGSLNTDSHALVLWTWAMMLARILYFHIGLLLLVIGAVAEWRRRFRMAAACTPLVVLTVLLPCMNFGPRGDQPAGPVLRIISANLLMINRNTQPILDEIAQSNADIVFLQEYTDHWVAAFKKRFATVYPYCIVYPQEDSFGAAIYSRYRFLGPPSMDSDMGNWSVTQLTAVVDVQGIPVECRNIHLMPPRKWDYTIEHFDEMRDFVRELAQAKDKPVIIAGDFNFTGSTLQARAINATGFHDAFVEAGTGRGTTWPVNGIFRYLPGIRLDHIFLSPALTCRQITTGTGTGSDHRPLIAEIALQHGDKATR
jgi:endonuclease/exonuclease/phosphatase (EEP) superfamily protein YafD